MLDGCERGDNQTASKPVIIIVGVNHDAMIFTL